MDARVRQVESAREFAFHLLKGVKQIALYRHDPAKFGAFLQPAHQRLATLTQTFGPLVLTVEPQNLGLFGTRLFTEGHPLPYAFYRDGVRELHLRPGITLEELETLTLIGLSNAEKGGEPALSQLWNNDLPHVEHVVLEGGAADRPGLPAKAAIEALTTSLHEKLRAAPGEYLRLSRPRAPDEGQGSLQGLSTSEIFYPVAAHDALKDKLQRQLEEDEALLASKLVPTVFEVLANEPADPSRIAALFLHLFDVLLLQNDFAAIEEAQSRLEALAEEQPPMAALRETVRAHLGQPAQVQRAVDVLCGAGHHAVSEALAYLASLRPEDLLPLLDPLEGIESAEIRKRVCDLLVMAARHSPDPFIQRLSSQPPRSVREMAYVLERAGTLDRGRLFLRVFKAGDPAVRAELLQGVAGSPSFEARRLLIEALKDEALPVRLLAARLLPAVDAERAASELLEIASDPSFDKRGAEEKTAWFRALGSTSTTKAVEWFGRLLAVKPGLLQRGRVLEQKLLAVQGLAEASTAQAAQWLQVVASDSGQPPEVVTLARQLAARGRVKDGARHA